MKGMQKGKIVALPLDSIFLCIISFVIYFLKGGRKWKKEKQN